MMNRAIVFGRVIAALAVTAALALGPARAAEPVFPPGSRIGLVPLPGMVPSQGFPGFEAAEKQAVIIITELPAQAYADLDKEMPAEALKAQGITVDNRSAIDIPGGRGFLLVARQEFQGVKVRKWLLVAEFHEITAMLNYQTPEGRPDGYADADVRAALASVAVRPAVPVAEQLAILPYAIKDLAGFRLVRVAPTGAALLTDGPKDAIEPIEQPLVMITLTPGAPDQATDRERDSFARRALAATPGIKDMRIKGAEPMRIGGQPGHQMLVDAKDESTGAELSLVQWLRFGGGAHFRLVAVARRDVWDKLFPRLRAVRDGIEPK
jgi:hypothetical protein